MRCSACADYNTNTEFYFFRLNLTDMRQRRVNKIIVGKVAKSPFEKLRDEENRQLLEWKNTGFKVRWDGKRKPHTKAKYQNIHPWGKVQKLLVITHLNSIQVYNNPEPCLEPCRPPWRVVKPSREPHTREHISFFFLLSLSFPWES